MKTTMKITMLFVCVIIISNIVNSVNHEDKMGTVVFVSLLWRHGARTPNNFFENDVYQDESYWPEGIGQITNEGKNQQYELGKWLRERYDRLLTDEYSPDRVYVQSTDVDRTLMSAQCNLAGMYPPKGEQVWNTHLMWQPIPIHTTPEVEDKVLAVKFPCPAYEKELQRVNKSPEIKKLYKKYQDVIDVLRDNGGGEVFDLKYIYDIYDAFIIEMKSGYSIPKWANDILPRLSEFARYRFIVPTWNRKLGRLRSGLLIQDIIENMKNRTENKNSRVVKMYSAHDLTIANLLNTMGLYDGDVPPLASCLMVELRVDDGGEYYVMLFYRTSSTEPPTLLTLPGCSDVCPLERFIHLTEPLIPEDWDKECRLS